MKLSIYDRSYQTFQWNKDDKNIDDEETCVVNPIEHKALDGDTYKEKLLFHTSQYRTKQISGILIFSGNTYGRDKNKLLYKCIPDKKCLPIFLIPYEQKKLTFEKNKKNMYVQFEYVNWINKHPHGKLSRVIGYVDDFNAFTEYSLYCKEVNISNQKLTKLISPILKNNLKKEITFEEYNLENRTSKEWNIFAIDPTGCVDVDDAMSISYSNNETIISVYISAVSLWIDKLSLWLMLTNSLERVSTMYLPENRRTMLPNKLEELCSLISGKNKPALAMDLHIINNEIINVSFHSVLINLTNNYEYEEKLLLECDDYTNIKKIIRKVNTQTKYKLDILDSHDVVEYLMLTINYYAGLQLKNNGGIFRNFNANILENGMNVNKEIETFLRTWGTKGGSYTTNINECNHDMLSKNIDVYCHISSPIRRLVDLINMTLLLQKNGVQFNLSDHFINKWKHPNNINIINNQMKSIRKIQNDINLLYKCLFAIETREIYYEGYIVDSKINKFNNEEIIYTVYLPTLGYVSKYKTNILDLEFYKKNLYTIHLFIDEDSLKKKIRIQPIII